ncbi:MAG: hypothetical protein U0Z53_25980 [Blastocatellia bacterium]
MAEITDLTEKLRELSESSPRAVRADDIVAEIRRMLGEQELARIYEHKIRTIRTRRFELKAPAKKVPVEVQHTLLGIELKIGKRRLLCPDLATARYLSVFARLGVEAVAVPYDITQISRLADELESSWFRMLMLADHLTRGRSARLHGLVASHLIAAERAEIIRLGSGPAIPQFNQNTRQRRR